MDSHLVAKILIPCDEGDYYIGTAFPIRENLIITARHVIYDGNVLKNSLSEVKAVWPSIEDECIKAEVVVNNPYSSIVEEVVFDGGKECDIVLLRCSTPKVANQALPFVPFRDPQAHEDWTGWGFPEIGQNDETGISKLISVLGKFHPPRSDSHRLTLTCEGDSLKKEGWCGLSGAPVLKGRVVYAVIAETPRNRAETFEAVSLSYLIRNNQKFASHFRLDSSKPDFSNAKKYLHDHKELKEALIQYVRTELNSKTESLDEVLTILLRFPVRKFLKYMFVLHKKRGVQLRIVEEFVRLILPYLYASHSPGLTDSIRATRCNAETGIVPIPFATDVSAELLMSNVDRRSADFRTVSISREAGSGYRVRPGRYRINMPPESGPSDIKKSVTDVTRDLNNRHSLFACVNSIKTQIEDALFETQVPSNPEKKYPREDKKNFLLHHLTPDEELERPGYYWLAPIISDDDDVFKEWLSLFAQEFKKEYPMIYMMSLDPSNDLELQEYVELEFLHELMLLKDKKD